MSLKVTTDPMFGSFSCCLATMAPLPKGQSDSGAAMQLVDL